jgi:hypothetical protein
MKTQIKDSHARILNYLKLTGGFVMMLSGEEPKLPTTKEECEEVFKNLETDLSPENLQCDGDVSAAQVRKTYNYYKQVWADVEGIAGYKREPVY